MAKTGVTDQQRQQVLDLHGQGMTRNAIARETALSGGTVTNLCAAAGLTFDRSETAAATQARQVDLAARRADALARELDILEQNQTYVLDVMDGTEKHQRVMRGAEGIEDGGVLDFLPSDDAQRLANARSSSVTIINRLTDTNAGEQAARGLLAAIADGLGIVDGPQS